MARADTLYSARIGSEWLERGRSNKIKCPVFRDGAAVAPSSGTVTIYDAGEAAVVDGASVTISDDVAEYNVPAGTLPSSRDLEPGWVFRWTLTMPDGVAHTFKTIGGLARSALYPVITDADLTGAKATLTNLRPASKTSWQDYIDDAWRDITDRIESGGRRPHLIMEPGALRGCHKARTYELIFADLALNGGPQFLDMARDSRAEYERAWAELRFTYDEDDDGFGASARKKQAAAATIWLC